MATRLRLSSIGRRVVSWARAVVMPTTTEAAQINAAWERPWLAEQTRVFAGDFTRRLTPLTGQNFTAETSLMRQAYRAMIAEPVVKAAVIGKITQVARQGIQVVPQDKKNPKEVEAAKFIHSQLLGASGTIMDLVWEILYAGLMDGYSVCEKCYGAVTKGEWQGRWTITELKSKDTQWLQLEVDPFLNVTGVYAMRANFGQIMDPKDFVIFSHMKLFQFPTGNSDLRAAYRSAEMIKACFRLRMVMLDKFSGPYLVGKSRDPGVRLQMQQVLRQARGQGWIAISDADEVQAIDLAANSGTDKFQEAINDFRKDMVISIQGSYLTMLEGANNSARGSAEEARTTSDDFVWFLVMELLGVINKQIVPDLMEPNYSDDVAHPRVTLPEIDMERIKGQLELKALALNTFKLPISRSGVYDLIGEGPPTVDDALMPPQEPQMPGGTNTDEGGQKAFGSFAESEKHEIIPEYALYNEFNEGARLPWQSARQEASVPGVPTNKVNAYGELVRFTEEDFNPAERVNLISEILYGLFGDKSAGWIHGPSKNAERRNWNATLHPRDPKTGRFIPAGSSQAGEAAKEAIGKVIQGQHSPMSHEEVLGHLNNLTVKQLRSLHQQFGQKVPGKLREQMVQGVLSRLPNNMMDRSTNKPEESPAIPVVDTANGQLGIKPETDLEKWQREAKEHWDKLEKEQNLPVVDTGAGQLGVKEPEQPKPAPPVEKQPVVDTAKGQLGIKDGKVADQELSDINKKATDVLNSGDAENSKSRGGMDGAAAGRLAGASNILQQLREGRQVNQEAVKSALHSLTGTLMGKSNLNDDAVYKAIPAMTKELIGHATPETLKEIASDDTMYSSHNNTYNQGHLSQMDAPGKKELFDALGAKPQGIAPPGSMPIKQKDPSQTPLPIQKSPEAKQIPPPVAKPPANQAKLLREIGGSAYKRNVNDPMQSLGGVGQHLDAIPDKVADAFDSHGTGSIDTLAHLLNGGLEPGREFYSSPLSEGKSGRGGHGVTLRGDSPFVVLGHPGQTIKQGGIGGVLVDELHSPDIPKLQKAFPGVKFVSAKDAHKLLPKVAGNAGPINYSPPGSLPIKQSAPPASPAAPPPINNPEATKTESKPEVKATVQQWSEANQHVHPEKREKISSAMTHALDSMPEPMRAAAMHDMDTPKFYNSVADVTKAISARTGKLLKQGQTIGGACATSKNGKSSLHIDYGPEPSAKPRPQGSSALPHYSSQDSHSSAVGIHAHEFGHAVDRNKKFSNSDGWKQAFASEIDHNHNPLSKYARSSHAEGFAEFVRLVTTNPKVAQQSFPRCWDFLKGNGLV